VADARRVLIADYAESVRELLLPLFDKTYAGRGYVCLLYTSYAADDLF